MKEPPRCEATAVGSESHLVARTRVLTSPDDFPGGRKEITMTRSISKLSILGATVTIAGAIACGSSSSPPASTVVSCHLITGSVASMVCGFYSASLAGGMACTTPYPTEGVCSSANLVGCCVTPEPVGSTDGFSATCFYDSSTADTAKMSCPGTEGKSSMWWQTTLPVYGHV
jgi:hypothetical protein